MGSRQSWVFNGWLGWVGARGIQALSVRLKSMDFVVAERESIHFHGIILKHLGTHDAPTNDSCLWKDSKPRNADLGFISILFSVVLLTSFNISEFTPFQYIQRPGGAQLEETGAGQKGRKFLAGCFFTGLSI